MSFVRNLSRRVRLLLLLGTVATCVWLLWFRASRQAIVSYTTAIQQATELHSEQKYGQVLQLLQSYVTELEQDAEGLYLLADARLQLPLPDNQHVSQADTGFRLVLSLDPDHERAVRRLFQMHLRGHAWSPAIKYGLKACELDPLDADLREDLAIVFYRDEQFGQALAQTNILLGQCPDRMTTAELQIRCRVAMRQSRAAIDEFVAGFLNNRSDSIAGTRLRCVLLDALGETNAARREVMLAVADVPSDSPHRLWLADELERHRLLATAMELIPEVASGKTAGNTNEFANRLFQAGEHQSLIRFTTEVSLPEASEDLVVQLAFSQWFLGLSTEAAETAKILENRATRSSRLWRRVFGCLVCDDIDYRQLLEAAQQGAMASPGSAAFFFMKAHALVGMGETDLGIAAYRRCIALTPRWVTPRLAVAQQLIGRTDHLAALVECCEVLRLNPRCDPAYDVLLLSSLELIRADGTMPDDIRTTVLNGIGLLDNATQDVETQNMLNAVGALLNGDQGSANRFVQQRLDALAGTEIDPAILRGLKLLAVDPDVRQQVQAITHQQWGMPLREIVQAALKLESTEAAVQWIEDYRQRGRKLDAVSQQLAIAEVHSVRGDAQAESHWIALLSDHAANMRVLKYAEQTPSLKLLPELRASIVELMQKVNPEGVEWQLSDVRLKLGQQLSEKELAAMVLRLSDLVAQAPTCLQGYVLLATAYSRVAQPNRAAGTLEAAIAAGFDRSEFRVRLAKYYLSEDPLKAISHAIQAFRLAEAGEQRAQALGVLVAAKARGAVLELFTEQLSIAVSGVKPAADKMRVTGVALAMMGDVERVVTRLAPLCGNSEVCFDLWLEVLRVSQVSHADSGRLVTQAESWGVGQPDRIRKLVAAWRGHGVRSGQLLSFRKAIRLIEPQLVDTQSTWDLMSAGELYERLEEHTKAIGVYTQLMNLPLTDRETVIALYRRSRTRLQGKQNLEVAAQDIEIARAITDDPQLVLLAAEILQQKGLTSEAALTISAALVKFPDSVELQQAVAAS